MYYFTNNLTKCIVYLRTNRDTIYIIVRKLVFAKRCKSFFKQMEYSSLMNILLYLWMEFFYRIKKQKKDETTILHSYISFSY